MILENILFLLYLLAAFVAALVPLPRRMRSGLISSGSLASGFRILLLLLLSRTVISQSDVVSISGTLINGYPLEFILTLNSYRYGFLLTAEFCFLLAHWMCGASSVNSAMISVLICLAQGLCSLFVSSDNAVTTGALQLLAGAVFFYLTRFAISESNERTAESISRTLYSLHFFLGLLMIAWGITEFGGRDLLFSRGSGSKLGLVLWLFLVVLAVPLAPWSKWFRTAVEHLPEGVTLTLITFLSGVALKFATLFTIVYPDLQWKHKFVLYVLGIIGCAFSISGLFSAYSKRKLLGSLPSFFFSLILVSVGVSKETLVLSAYYICLFVPIFAGLVLYASVMKVVSPIQKVFVGLLFALILGIPGTPVYQIFSGIGARSLALGVKYTIVFGLLWFFYFSANVHICRRIFMDQDPPETGVVSNLDSMPLTFAGYGVFLMCFIIAITQIAGRIL